MGNRSVVWMILHCQFCGKKHNLYSKRAKKCEEDYKKQTLGCLKLVEKYGDKLK